jgi:hypothetical protein
MTQPTLKLDHSKVFSECRGERMPDDPQYRVHNWQGGRMGGHMVVLPFDANGDLVPDDGKLETWKGTDAEAKPVTYHPLYSPLMRKYLAAKLARMESVAATQSNPDALEEPGEDEDNLGEAAASSIVNFVAWLKGTAKYQPHVLRKAAQEKYSKNYPKIRQLVVDMVLDERLVPEADVCAELRKYLPASEAA